MITCKHCQQHLLAYQNRELSPRLSAKIRKHLESCDRCYSVLHQNQQLTRELQRQMRYQPSMQATPPAFERVWTTLQTSPKHIESQRYHHVRYGLAMLVFSMIILIPFAIGRQSYTLASPPTQPSPLMSTFSPIASTPTVASTTIALHVGQTPEPIQFSQPVLDLLNTP